MQYSNDIPSTLRRAMYKVNLEIDKEKFFTHLRLQCTVSHVNNICKEECQT